MFINMFYLSLINKEKIKINNHSKKKNVHYKILYTYII